MRRPHWHRSSKACVLIGCMVAAAVCPAASGHGGGDEVLTGLELAVRANPDIPDLRFQRADARILHGDWIAALADIQWLEQHSAGKYATRLLAARAWSVGGRWPAARRAAEKHLEGFPQSSQARLVYARILGKLGNKEASLEQFSLALESDSKPPPEWFVEYADAMIEAGNTPDAVVFLEQSIERVGPSPALIYRMLDLEIAEKRWDAALRRIDVLRRSSTHPEPWMAKYAAVLREAGKPDDSRAAWHALQVHLAALPTDARESPSMIALAREAEIWVLDR